MISERTKELIKKYQSWYNSSQIKEEVPTVHVDEVALKVAAFYEKIKGVVDWKEEHLLRKRAIERILKRRVIFQDENPKMAESLVYELIRGGHFPNDNIPESKINEIQKIIVKYFYISENTPKEDTSNNKKENNGKNKIQGWLLNIASYEIENTLAPDEKEVALIEYMNEIMKERIRINEGAFAEKTIEEEEKNIQIYIAIQRALFKFDDSTITYYLLIKRYPDWHNFDPSTPLLLKIAQNIYLVQKSIKKDLNHPLAGKFLKLCERQNAPYLILGDIIEEDPLETEEKLEKPEILEDLIRKSYDKRSSRLKERIKRAAIYSTISVFITKIALALAIEIPIDKLLTGEFSNLTLGINVLFPPLLMLLLVATIKPPGKENIDRVIMEIMKIAHEGERKDIYEIKIPKKTSGALNTVISIVYFLAFIISFGIIIEALQKLDFNVPSMAIFILFVSIISFLGVNIRERSKELLVGKEKERLIHSVFDLFTLPIIRMGRWFSKRWANFNIALIISALVDMPFLTFVDFLEQWRYFLKNKKEEIN